MGADEQRVPDEEAGVDCDAGPEHGVSVLPDADWCVAAADGSCAGVHAEGGAGSEAADFVGGEP